MDGEEEASSSYYIPPSNQPNYLPNDQWNWINLDKYWTDPRPKTGISTQMPDGFDYQNTKIFISFDGENALTHFSYWNDNSFVHTSPTFPIGLEVHFISVAMDDESLHYTIQAATIGNQHIETIANFEPITEEELDELIDALP